MPTNQKYSARIHSRRQLLSINTHIASSINQLTDIGDRYIEALPKVKLACDEMIKMLIMVEAMVIDIRENI